MAHPFGNHPTFAQYCTWANQTESCKINTALIPDDQGGSLTRISAPNGRHVIMADYAQDERLLPSQIAYMDRRLGLRSPWNPDLDS
jgi:hypothetical protein